MAKGGVRAHDRPPRLWSRHRKVPWGSIGHGAWQDGGKQDGAWRDGAWRDGAWREGAWIERRAYAVAKSHGNSAQPGPGLRFRAGQARDKGGILKGGIGWHLD
jgi:hypothetical protein